MEAILRQIQTYGITLPSIRHEETMEWCFDQKISQKDVVFFRRLVEDHALLDLQYSIHCARLAHNLANKDRKAVTEQVEAALAMAELLEHIYCYYLNVPRETVRFRREQAVYRQLLIAQGYRFSKQQRANEDVSSPSKKVRDLTANNNLARLFTLRLRRLLIMIGPAAGGASGYARWAGAMERFTLPIVAQAAWIFFTPRLLTNLFLTGKHLIPGAWMSQEERDLGWQARFRAQMSRRWFELANDSLWCVAGILGCFVLLGTLAPVAFYIGVALQVYDLVLVSLRAFVELSRLKKLERQYVEMLKNADPNTEEQQQIKDSLFHLRKRLDYEFKRHTLTMINNAVLVVAICLILPALLFNPFFALAGAALAVVNTIVCYFLFKHIDKQKPVDKVKLDPVTLKETNLRFFKPASPACDTTPRDQEESISTPSMALG